MVTFLHHCTFLELVKRRPEGSGVFECALATVTLPLINLLCYIQQTSKAGLRYHNL